MIIAAATIASISVSAVAAENFQKLSDAQIRAKIIGMQLTDEVHWRYVYDRDGRLRSYSMGTKKIGKWAVENEGVGPDINVENTPKEVIAGHDLQLEKAVAEAMRLLKEKPVVRATTEPAPPTWGKRVKPPLQ